MSLLRDLTMGAIGGVVGYGMGESRERKTSSVRLDQPLASLIEEYARAHNIFGRYNSFHRELMRIAEYYRDPYYP